MFSEGVVTMEMAQCLVLYLDTLLSYITKQNAKENGGCAVFFLGILPGGGKIEHRNFMGGQSY